MSKKSKSIFRKPLIDDLALAVTIISGVITIITCAHPSIASAATLGIVMWIRSR